MTIKKRLYFVIASLILTFCFIIFSYWITKGLFDGLDFDTMVKLQNHIGRRFDLPLSLFSLLGSVEFTLLVLTGIFLLVIVKVRRFFWGIFLYFLILFVELMGKLFIFHPGPPFMFFRYALGFAFPSSYIHTNYSYPSGHAARSAFLVTIITFLVFKLIKDRFFRWTVWTSLLLLLGLMVISRVYLGEHWLSDVLGGLLLGISLGNFALALW